MLFDNSSCYYAFDIITVIQIKRFLKVKQAIELKIRSILEKKLLTCK